MSIKHANKTWMPTSPLNTEHSALALETVFTTKTQVVSECLYFNVRCAQIGRVMVLIDILDSNAALIDM